MPEQPHYPIHAVTVHQPGWRRNHTDHTGRRMHIERTDRGGLAIYSQGAILAEYAAGEWSRYTVRRSSIPDPT